MICFFNFGLTFCDTVIQRPDSSFNLFQYLILTAIVAERGCSQVSIVQIDVHHQWHFFLTTSEAKNMSKVG